MAYRLLASVGSLLVASTMSQTINLEYYRSAHCDSVSSDFYLDKYTTNEVLVNDQVCHKTPARTLAMRLANDMSPACSVLAYDDYDCSSLVSSVLTKGTCVAATKARIGSWQILCDDTFSQSQASMSATHAPVELKRRERILSATIRDVANANMTTSRASSVEATQLSFQAANVASSAVNASAAYDAATTTTAAALNSGGESRTGLDYNVTSSSIARTNTTYTLPSMTTATPSSSTVTFTGTTGKNGTAVFHVSGASLPLAEGRILSTMLCGTLAVLSLIMII